MGKEFFVAFENKIDERELIDTVRRMNQVAYRYSNSIVNVVQIEHGNYNGRRGLWVRGVGICDSTSCYSILSHRFFMEANDAESGVYFYNKELENSRKQLVAKAI